MVQLLTLCLACFTFFTKATTELLETDVLVGQYPGQENINIFPIINLDPIDMSCMYLKVCIKKAKKLNLVQIH